MVFDAKTVSMLVKETWRTLYPSGAAVQQSGGRDCQPAPFGAVYHPVSDGNAADPRDRGKDDRSKCGSCTAGNRGVPVHQPYGRGIIKGN